MSTESRSDTRELKTNQQSELILANAGEGIYGLDKAGLTTFANPAAARMLGASIEELIGCPMHQRLHHSRHDGTSYPVEECPIHTTLTDGKVRQIDNEVFWRADGKSFPVQYSCTPIMEADEITGAVIVFRDMTRQLEDKSALEALTRRNELILAAAGEGIYGIGKDGMATFVNPAAIEMTGWTIEDTIGQRIHDLHHHTKADGSPYPREQCPIYAATQDGLVHACDHEVFWRKDGSSFPVEYTSTPMYENGELAGAVVVFRDISGRKEAEKKLRAAHAAVERMKDQLEAENTYLQEEIRVEHNFAGIVGKSYAIQQVLDQIKLVANTDASVLITGESGTGKELVARAIHQQSGRSDRPLIRVNCAAIPRDLFESEFFGHIKGAFTGAIRNRTGRFELADGGTIFLDEVGEIPLELQSKLLRVIQEGQFEKVGEERTRTVDVRIIAATNRDLKADAEAKLFREDLYFRLNVFPIEAVPLRSRIDDIPLLTAHFISLICGRQNRPEPALTQANVNQLQAYDWPGNIRELQNVIERAIIVSLNNRLDFNLPNNLSKAESAIAIRYPEETSEQPYTEEERLARDRDNISQALKITNGKVSGTDGAAQLLGIRPTTLASRMKTLGVSKPG